MNLPTWAVLLLAWIAVDALIVAFLIRRNTPPPERSWFDHDQAVKSLVERIEANTRPAVITHPCSYGGDELEFPVTAGWDEDAIVTQLDEIGRL